MATVDVKDRFETLAAITNLYGCDRQLILSGTCPLLQNPYVSYGDRVLLDFKIGLTADEADLPLGVLCEKFGGLDLIKFPKGNIENLKSSFNGKNFFMVVYHVYSMEEGISLYTRLKEDYFTNT